ncbi:MAG: glycosyltransferase family 2 protein [Verrucomicrobiota bacterium]|jgi:glycosyltransferase involved in cell wall biosynthesis
MPKIPKISVITPSYNSATTIRETITSVLKQNYPNLEHIVVDGGSTDGSLAILQEYPHLLWVSEKDEGHYDAMNKGIKRSTGEIIGILNADDCYCENALKKVGEAMESHPEWDGLFGDVIYTDGESREIMRRQEAVFDYDVLRFGMSYVHHPTLFLRKAIYDRLGGYKHREFLNNCDVELCLRLGQNGCQIGHLPAFLATYRFHSAGQSADRRVARNMKAENLRLRLAHGCPAGLLGKAAGIYARLRRQWQKIRHRGTCDLIPGRFILRKHMRERTNFSSNSGVDKV